MQRHEDNLPQHVDARPGVRGALVKAVTVCGVMGGAYGAAMGALVGTAHGGARLIGISSGIMALICAVAGTGYGALFGMLNRIRHGRLFASAVAAACGAILGGFFAILALALFHAIGGGFCGWLVGRVVVRREQRFVGSVWGSVVGACLGATAAGLRQNQAVAFPMAGVGAAVGAVGGIVLILLLIRTINALLREHEESRSS